MYEHRSNPLLPRPLFYRRFARNVAIGLTLVVGALLIGMIGYHLLENMNWVDSFANASMILSGMGPLGELKTTAGKIFAGCYALFSGVAFLTSFGVMFAPVFHRFLHKFHLEASAASKSDKEK